MTHTAVSRLSALLITDIAGSAALKSRLGGAAYSALAVRHDELFRRIVNAVPGGEVSQDTGDGFLARFVAASDAVEAALRFQSELARAEWNSGDGALTVRAGIHVGEVIETDRGPGEPPKLIGLAVDLASRLAGLAQPRQVLLSRAAFDDARQWVREHPAVDGRPVPELRWQAHGPYLFKGADEPAEVFEVGGAGLAPMSPPRDSEKARRAVRAGEEETLGWRPATGLEVPQRPGWMLERRLGEGGFGEVWLGTHARTSERRVFKFCFDAERLRSFRRELTLFRLLRETLGERGDIARLYEVQLEQPPYFLESEYSELGDLGAWAQSQGGIGRVPMEQRLDIVARVADALAAAHSVGVLHKDIKPSNILIFRESDGGVRPRIADFGIGVLTDRQSLAQRNITVAGFTVSELTENDSSRTGTRMYSPPEALAGRAFTVAGDIYALGVLLYQMAVGDLSRPLAEGWQRDVDDELLREDIAQCVDGDPARRPASATVIAERLRALPERRDARQRRAEALRLERRRRRVLVAAGAALGVVTVLGGLLAVALVRERGLRERADRAAKEAQAANGFLTDMLLSAGPYNPNGANTTVRDVIDGAGRSIDAGALRQTPAIEGQVLGAVAQTYIEMDLLPEAQHRIEQYAELATGELAYDRSHLVRVLHLRTLLSWMRTENAEADRLARETLELAKQVLDKDDPLLGRAWGVYGLLRHLDDDNEEAAAAYTRALEILRAAYGEEHPRVAWCLARQAQIMSIEGDSIQAEAQLRRALEMYNKHGEHYAETPWAKIALAEVLVHRGAYDEADALYRSAVATYEKSLGMSHTYTLWAMGAFGEFLRATGRYAEAIAVAQRATEGYIAIRGPDSPEAGWCLAVQTDAMVWAHRAAEAEPIARRVAAMFDAESGVGKLPMTVAQLTAMVLHRAGKSEEAERLLRASLARHTEDEVGRELVAMSQLFLGTILADVGAWAEAERLADQARAVLLDIYEPDDPDSAWADWIRIRAMRQRGAIDEALALGATLINLLRADNGDRLPPSLVVSAEHAITLTAAGRLDEAEALLADALSRRERWVDEQSFVQLRLCLAMVGLCEARHAAAPGDGHAERAAQWQRRVRAIESGSAGGG